MKKSKATLNIQKDEANKEIPIVIDSEKSWVFHSEDEMYHFFLPQISALEKEYYTQRSNSDFTDEESDQMIEYLDEVLNSPLEIWMDGESLSGFVVFYYLGEFVDKSSNESFFYVAITHQANGQPSFIYLHFPTRERKLYDFFRKGECIYSKELDELAFGSIEGDSLSEGDELSVGLFKAMLSVRQDSDVLRTDFHKYAAYREPTIEEADEIWRRSDLSGNILVTFIKEIQEQESESTHYVVVTQEEETSNVHALLFSFPTKDNGLLDRYRQGESLHVDDVSHEASH